MSDVPQQPAPVAPPASPNPYAAMPPAPYPQPFPQSSLAQSKNWMNIVSLVLSLAGLVTGITAIVGIVFGHLGTQAARRGEADNGGMGLAGLITGYVILSLQLLFVIAYVAFIVVVVAAAGTAD